MLAVNSIMKKDLINPHDEQYLYLNNKILYNSLLDKSKKLLFLAIVIIFTIFIYLLALKV